jgi:hypothetical protein
MDFSKVKWSEVGEEGFVDEIIINAEVEGVGARLGRVFVRNPIESAWNYFDRFVVRLSGLFVARWRALSSLHCSRLFMN